MISRGSSRREARWHTVVASLVVIAGIVVSAGLFLWVHWFEQQQWQEAFRHRAAVGITAIQRSIQEHLGGLYRLGARTFAAAGPRQREAFLEATQDFLKRHPEVQGVGWVPRVIDAEREAFLASAQKEGMLGFDITEWTPKWQVVRASRHDVYYPIFYLASLDGQQAAVGFNLGSVPSYMDAMQKALSSEEVTASAWHALLQDSGEQFGFLVFFPVYKSTMPHRTYEERRSSLQGFLMAIVRLSTLVEQALRGLDVGPIGLELADVTDATSRHLLSFQLSDTHTSSWRFFLRQSAQTEAIRADTHREATFPVAGRQWSVLAYPLSGVPSAPIWQAWVVLMGGLAGTLVCVAFLRIKWQG